MLGLTASLRAMEGRLMAFAQKRFGVRLPRALADTV
jgi:hypothetical protein